MHPLEDRIQNALGRRPRRLAPLSGGCVAQVRRADFDAGDPVVVKFDDGPAPTLDREAFMLRHLAERTRLPVPRVLASEPSLLIIEFIEAGGSLNAAAQRQAAELLADLHAIRPEPPNEHLFGFARDTLIGPLNQPNGWSRSWVEFFRDKRLLHMAEEAGRAHGLDARVHARLEKLASRLGELIDEPPHPSLIHGDIWDGNVLARDGRIAAFIDPAIAYAHPEQELAFTTLFNTFARPFFDRYRELRPISPGFDDGPRPRRDVYNLYPLLVHTRLFGGHYESSVATTLSRLGF